MDTTTQNTTPKKEETTSKKMLWMIAGIIIILLAAAGYLAWLAWSLNNQNSALVKDKTSAQSKVATLTKQLADAQKLTTTSTTPCACTPKAASSSLKNNIHDAISSKNTAALEGYMASSVKVVIAASEKGDTETPTQAVASLDYLSSGTSPWDFSIAAATLSNWKSHFYGQYFSDTSYAGKAASGQVVSFDFDCNGKISQIFMAASDGLLTE
jgi:cytoskeletal protein RodZ